MGTDGFWDSFVRRKAKYMRNELLTIGPFTIYGYGFMIAMGILAAYFTAEYRAKKYGLPYEHVFPLVIWCVLGGFAGAKVLFWLTEFRTVAADPAFLIRSLSDGFVVYGGILGGILSGYIYCRRKRIDFLKFFDLLIPSVALAQGFGRIGCLLAGCCYGKETNGIFAITFHHSDFAPNNVPLIPTQIYSSVLDFLHFFLLVYITKHKKADGQVAAVYLVCYSIGRFVLEFFRGDLERGNVGALSTSQFISLFTAAAGIGLLVWTGMKKQKA